MKMVFLLKKFKNELFFFFNKHIKNKMQYLNQDVQIHIFSYLEPEDIIHCYYNRCFTNILKELTDEKLKSLQLRKLKMRLKKFKNLVQKLSSQVIQIIPKF